jgi:predicted adenylyl cyclase CyaB
MTSPAGRGGPIETEAKWRLTGQRDADRVRSKLRALGATRDGVARETNVLYDDAQRSLQRDSRVLRLRRFGRRREALLTYKGPARMRGGIKRRTEIEVAVADAAALRGILGELGLRPSLTYAKTRETWRAGRALVAIDELAFGTYCEIEGPAREQRRLARELELDFAECEERSYPTLVREHAAKRRR